MSVNNTIELCHEITKHIRDSGYQQTDEIPIVILDMSTNNKFKLVAVVGSGKNLMLCINPIVKLELPIL